MASGISVHIGMNKVDAAHYLGPDGVGWDGALTACESDASAMQAIAESRGFETRSLLTAAAKADAVIQVIEDAAGKLGSGDIFLISYAGHGGQVSDTNHDEEGDTTDETWLLYDRQLVDDELFGLWGKFEPGVRIVVVSDSCHSGTVTRSLDAPVPNPVATRQAADAQSPRYRAMPKDVMGATYREHKAEYDRIQSSSPDADEVGGDIGATVLLISGCQDDQLSLDGLANGLFTENLLGAWKDGAWTGPYKEFHAAIRSGMPPSQQPNLTVVGAPNSVFEQQNPFTLG